MTTRTTVACDHNEGTRPRWRPREHTRRRRHDLIDACRAALQYLGCCSLPVCIFTGTMCDGCALDYHDAQDEAEETGHHGDPLHPDHDLVTMTVDAADGRTTIAYRAGAIVYRAPADVPGSGA